jgi:hypothetical protein
LIAKIAYYKTFALLQDYDSLLSWDYQDSEQLASTAFSSARNSPEAAGHDWVLIGLRRVLSQISYMLDTCETRADIASTLLSYLAHRPVFADIIANADHFLPRPFLTTSGPLSDLADPALLRTLSLEELPARPDSSRVPLERFSTRLCAINADGVYVAVTSPGNLLSFRETHSGNLRWSRRFEDSLWHFALSSDGSTLAVICKQLLQRTQVISKLLILDSASGVVKHAFLAEGDYVLSQCAISADGNVVISIDSGPNRLRIWNLSSRGGATHPRA